MISLYVDVEKTLDITKEQIKKASGKNKIDLLLQKRELEKTLNHIEDLMQLIRSLLRQEKDLLTIQCEVVLFSTLKVDYKKLEILVTEYFNKYHLS